MKNGLCAVCGISFERANSTEKFCSLACAILSKTEVRQEGCWPWTGSQVSAAGYGYMAYKKRHYLAHRAAWIVANGREIPPKGCICHSCDNPNCVNPEHLWLGTHQDNRDDMLAKGRGRLRSPPIGAANPAAKLTDEQVAFIKSTPCPRGTQKEWAVEFGVDRNTIYRIQRGRGWMGVS